MNTNLMIHMGSSRVERGQVFDVPTPEPTDRWHPIPHGSFIQQVESALDNTNYKVVAESHALSRSGDRYFGLLQVSNGLPGADDHGFVVGLRNTHDKSFSAGIAMGLSVFNCDNLSFFGEITVARMHTRFIMRDLPILTSRAVGLLAEKWTGIEKRIDLYKHTELGDRDANDFIVRAIDLNAATVTQLPAILKQWRTPDYPEFAKDGKTAWRLYNAFTEVYKKGSLDITLVRSTRLHGLLDAQVGFQSASETVKEGTVDAEVVVQS